MVNHYRWDFIGLSTDQKPTPETSEKVVDGSTFYCSDNSKLYVFYKDQWYERTATGGGGGGGTSDFNELTNRPKYNGTTMTGETNIPEVIDSAFTGTDGTSDGVKGLVPAPTTLDAGKFLSANGSWISAPEGVNILTADDYNYPAENPNRIYLPFLPEGFYRTVDNSIYVQESTNQTGRADKLYYVSSEDSNGYVYVWVFYGGANVSSGQDLIRVWKAIPQTGVFVSSNHPISAEEYNKYYAVLTESTDPTTSVPGNPGVGRIYINTTSGEAFICVDTTGGVNIWKQITNA